jgi:meso-butanediol dehydrogenase/(S,S)-butanediol dehydrogenase/diacetyl reductase
MKLKDKVAIVTGGASGIGRATSLLFAKEGANVIVADLAQHAANTVAEEARAIGSGDSMAIQVDISDTASVTNMVDAIIEKFGRIDVLINNAGYGFAGDVVTTDEAAWDRLMAVNLKGVYLGSKYVIPHMARQGGGVIVNTASTGSIVGIRDRAAYCASKGAVASLTKCMALDHASDDIRVNAICPGTTDSPYHYEIAAKSEDPNEFRRGLEERQVMNRLGTPEEIASGMLFLASDDSSFATGSLLVVDGGMTAY